MKARVLAAVGTTILMVSPVALGMVIHREPGSAVGPIDAIAQWVATISEPAAILLFGIALLACTKMLQRVVFPRS